MAIDTSINNNTALQILGEIVNLLNNQPVALTPWIGQPPYTDTKTDLLYEIWQALKNGTLGAGSAKNKYLFFTTNVSGNQAAFLPANCLVTNVVAKTTNTAAYNFTFGITTDQGLFFESLGIYNLYERSAPAFQFIKNASQVHATFTLNTTGDVFTFLIFYTEIAGTGF